MARRQRGGRCRFTCQRQHAAWLAACRSWAANTAAARLSALVHERGSYLDALLRQPSEQPPPSHTAVQAATMQQAGLTSRFSSGWDALRQAAFCWRSSSIAANGSAFGRAACCWAGGWNNTTRRLGVGSRLVWTGICKLKGRRRKHLRARTTMPTPIVPTLADSMRLFALRVFSSSDRHPLPGKGDALAPCREKLAPKLPPFF